MKNSMSATMISDVSPIAKLNLINEKTWNPWTEFELDLSHVTEEQEQKELLISYKKKSNYLKELTIILNFQDQTDEQIDALALLVTQLHILNADWFKHSLKIHENRMEIFGIRRLIRFFRIFNNPAISMLELSSNSAFDVGLLSEDAIKELVSNISRNRNITYVTLGENNFSSMGVDFLQDLDVVAHAQNPAWTLDPFCNAKPVSNQKPNFEGLDHDRQFQLARLYCKTICNHRRNLFVTNELTCVTNLSLSATELYAIAEECVASATWTTGIEEPIRGILKHFQLEPHHQLSLCKKYLDMGGHISTFQNIPALSPLQLELFLQAFMNKPDECTNLLRDQNHLLTTPSEGCKFISAWEGGLSDGQTMPNFDEEVEILKKASVIERLEAVGAEYWNAQPFFEEFVAIATKKFKQDTMEALHLICMIEWFSWTCALLKTKPEIDQRISTDPVFSKMLGKVFKQILDFANPEKRYIITTLFLNQICADQDNLYFKLVNQESPANTFLLAIPFAQIILKKNNIKKRPALVKSAQQSLENFSRRYSDGHTYRTVLSGLQAIAEDKTITPAQKLALIQAILSETAAHQETKNLLNQFAQVRLEARGAERNEALNGIMQSLSNLVDEKTFEALALSKYIPPNPEEETADLLTHLTKKTDHYYNQKGKQTSHRLTRQLEIFSNDCLKLTGNDRNTALNNRILTIQNLLDEDRDSALFKRLALNSYITKPEKEKKDLIKSCTDVLSSHFNPQEFKQQMSYFIMIQGLAKLGGLAQLVDAEQGTFDTSTFNIKVAKLFKNIFGLEGGQFDFYAETFALCRNEGALLTYLSKISSLRSGGDVVELFKEVVRSILSPDSHLFYQLRYDKTRNAHLEAVFSGKPKLEQLWQECVEMDFNNFIQGKDVRYKIFTPNYPVFFRKKIFGHRHLEPQNYTALEKYLNAKDAETRETAKAESEALPDSGHDKIQKNLIQLMEIPIEDHTNQLKFLRGISTELRKLGNHEGDLFRHDIEMLIRGVANNLTTPKPLQSKGLKLVNTDHYWHLFMSGTDVEGSCQAVDGTPSLNQCLMAYVADGKYKLLGVVDADGKLMARAYLRLMLNQNTQEPVLLLEEIYPDTVRSEIRQALELFARAEAERLNLPLLSMESTEDSLVYPEPLECVGSIAPREYVDALFNAQDGGMYTITGAQVLWMPPALVLALGSGVTEPASSSEHPNSNIRVIAGDPDGIRLEETITGSAEDFEQRLQQVKATLGMATPEEANQQIPQALVLSPSLHARSASKISDLPELVIEPGLLPPRAY